MENEFNEWVRGYLNASQHFNESDALKDMYFGANLRIYINDEPNRRYGQFIRFNWALENNTRILHDHMIISTNGDTYSILPEGYREPKFRLSDFQVFIPLTKLEEDKYVGVNQFKVDMDIDSYKEYTLDEIKKFFIDVVERYS